MSRTTSRTKKLRLEILENRAMLAGNVTATLVGHSLFLRGDAAANGIVVSPQNGQIVVSSLATASGDSTTINGKAGPASFSGVTRKLVIDMGDGNDVVVVGDAFATAARLAVKYVEIETGSGDDTVAVTDADPSRKLEIETGSGSDRVAVGTIPTGFLPAAAGTVVRSGSVSSRRIEASTGSGTDQVNVAQVTASRKLKVQTGAGDDTVRFGQGAAAGTTTVTARRVSIDTDSGADQVTLDATRVERKLRVELDSGNDSLNVGQTAAISVGWRSYFYGGSGENTFNEGTGNSLGRLRKYHFQAATDE